MITYDVSLAKAARIAGVSPRSMAREILRGRLPAIGVGRTFRINRQEFEHYLANARVTPAIPITNLPLEGQGSFGFDGEVQEQVQDFYQESAERTCQELGT